jgi:LacI family transcriptional regulator
VVVLTDHSVVAGAAMLNGIARYAAGLDWTIESTGTGDKRAAADFIRSAFRDRRVDGLLVHGGLYLSHEAIVRPGVPVVQMVTDPNELPDVPCVVHDERAAGRLVGEHLLGRGLRDLAVCGVDASWADERGRGLQDAAGDLARVRRLEDPRTPGRACNWTLLFSRASPLPHWLETLPKPVGVLGVSDEIAALVISTAGRLGLRVPQDVAVVGVDNQIVRATMSRVPISSVDLDLPRVGEESARKLDALMAGKHVDRVTVVPPRGLVARQSSDALATSDEVVLQAHQLIREEAHRMLRVDHVAARLNISRAQLERRFANALGKSPGHFLRVARLDRAARMLAESDLKLSEIATRCGFTQASYLVRAFRQHTGLTPAAYRRRHAL